MCDDNTTTFAVGIRCQRCSGTSTIRVGVDVAVDYDDFRRFGWACPHCFDETTDGAPTIAEQYDVLGYRVFDVVPDFVDPSRAIDAHDLPPGDSITDTQAADFFAVFVDGKTGGDRASDRGVTRGTVTKQVARTRDKIRAEA